MSAGVLIGFLFRNSSVLSKSVGISVIWAIYLLLFLLGISVGSNETILKNFAVIGLNALIITSGAIAGSVILSWFTYKRFFREP